MPYTKGHPKIGGRKKGSLNQSTVKMRNHLASILKICEENMTDDIKSLKPAERLKFWTAMQQFVVPKFSPVRPECETFECPEQILISKEVVHRGMNADERRICFEE